MGLTVGVSDKFEIKFLMAAGAPSVLGTVEDIRFPKSADS